MAPRELWIKIEKTLPPQAKRRMLRECRSLCNVVFMDQGDVDLAKEEGLKVASLESGDIKVYGLLEVDKVKEAKKRGETVAVYVPIKDKRDLDAAINACTLEPDYLIVSCFNWKIIPLENLVASKGKCKILAEVESAEEARTAVQTLELGSDGVVLKTVNKEEVMTAKEILGEKVGKLKLSMGKVVELKPLPMGLRACVDTCEIMSEGEGMLVGSQSNGLFLMEAEVTGSPFTSPRPFRVNAGAISSYVLMKEGKTKYLSELGAGDEVLIVDRGGSTRVGVVGRVKIERRPLVMVTVEVEGDRYKTVVQNAETIRFVSSKGSKPVTELKPGDEVLMKLEVGGRHFGTLVEEEFLMER
jgi:3-dehydroquinate synthase II